MMKDIINFLDKDYNLVKKDSHLSSNQLRTRPSSFASILGAWRNWRISLAEKRLENKKDKLLKEEFKAAADGHLTEAANNALIQKTQAIAKLEEKIRILSRENVPRNFVATHAIKLRKKMYENMAFNGNNAYVVGADKYEKVFEPEPIPVPEAEPVIPEVDNNVNMTDSSELVEDIAASADTTSVEVPVVEEVAPEKKEVEVVPSELQRGAIQAAIDNEFEKIKNSQKIKMVAPEDVAEAVKNVSTVSRSDIASEIDAHLDQIDAPVDESQNFQNEINSVFADADAHLNDMKVNQNGSSAAKIDRYNDEGLVAEKPWIEEEQKIKDDDIPKVIDIPVNNDPVEEPREEIPVADTVVDDVLDVPVQPEPVEETPDSKEWVPLTDEQIELFRKDLEEHPIVSTVSDDLEDYPDPNVTLPEDIELPTQDEAVRDFVVVTPDREEHPTNVEEFVPVETEPVSTDANERVISVNHETSKEELEQLRARIEGLKARQHASKKAMDEAERMDQNTAERATEALRDREESDLVREEQIGRLREYGDALEEDCIFNENRARIAIENVECNERFIQLQRERIRDNDELIDSLSSLVGPEATNVRRR